MPISDSFFWLFSTVTQSFIALAGIIGTFSIYFWSHYQQRIKEERDKLHTILKRYSGRYYGVDIDYSLDDAITYLKELLKSYDPNILAVAVFNKKFKELEYYLHSFSSIKFPTDFDVIRTKKLLEENLIGELIHLNVNFKDTIELIDYYNEYLSIVNDFPEELRNRNIAKLICLFYLFENREGLYNFDRKFGQKLFNFSFIDKIKDYIIRAIKRVRKGNKWYLGEPFYELKYAILNYFNNLLQITNRSHPIERMFSRTTEAVSDYVITELNGSNYQQIKNIEDQLFARCNSFYRKLSNSEKPVLNSWFTDHSDPVIDSLLLFETFRKKKVDMTKLLTDKATRGLVDDFSKILTHRDNVCILFNKKEKLYYSNICDLFNFIFSYTRQESDHIRWKGPFNFELSILNEFTKNTDERTIENLKNDCVLSLEKVKDISSIEEQKSKMLNNLSFFLLLLITVVGMGLYSIYMLVLSGSSISLIDVQVFFGFAVVSLFMFIFFIISLTHQTVNQYS